MRLPAILRIPRGYGVLRAGEKLKRGDRYWDKDHWEMTKGGGNDYAHFLTYIRRIKPTPKRKQVKP